MRADASRPVCYRRAMRSTPLLLAVMCLASIAAHAEPAGPAKRAASPRNTIAFFSDLQEAGPSSPEEIAERRGNVGDDSEGIAADAALNDWKSCVLASVSRWAALKPGPGTIVDGAFGRCADIERQYRAHLLRLTQDGRVVMDLSMGRAMTRALEEAWRPRLIAAALDQELPPPKIELPR